MKILYGARNARADILKAVTRLACFFTKWTSQFDRRLHRLVCYIHSTYNYRLVGWIGDKPSAWQPHLFADADFLPAAMQRNAALRACISRSAGRTAASPLHG